MTPTKTYTPYTAEFQPGDRFLIKYKDNLIVAEGRQRDSSLIRATVDLLNAAFSFGVQDVRDQVDPVLNDYKAEIDELKHLVSVANNEMVEATNRYFNLKAEMQKDRDDTEAQAAVAPTVLFEVVESSEQQTADSEVDEPVVIDQQTVEAVDSYVDEMSKPTKKAKTSKKKGK